MNQVLETIAMWLADYYLLSGVLLAVSFAVLALLRQPVRRRAVAQSVVVGMFVLAALCAAPGWSTMSLLTPQPPALSRHAPNVVHVPQSAGKVAADETMEPNHVEAAAAARHVASSTSARSVADLRVATPALSWPALIGLVWSGGALGAAMWLALGSFAARRMRREARPAPHDLVELMNRVAGLNENPPCRVDLLLSSHIEVAVALGIRRPAVLLPEKWTREFPLPLREGLGESSDASPNGLRTILAHELAHIENRDLYWLAASRTLLIPLWAQPLYWLLRRQMRLDQEALADAAAAEITSRQSYAEQLVAWARDIAARPVMRLTPAVGLWESPSQLRQRIALLLDPRLTLLRECSRLWRWLCFGMCVITAIGLSLVTFEPANSQIRAKVKPPATETTGTPGGQPTALDKTVETKPRHFVRIVADPHGKLTFEGEKITWDDVAGRLQKVSNRSETVLEFAISSDEISVRELEKARLRAMTYAHELGFQYSSYIGVHPLGSKGSAPLASSQTHTAEGTPDEDDDEQGSQMLRDIRSASAPILAAMAKDHGYGLEPSQDLRRVALPFPPIRMEYYQTGHPSQSEAIKDGPSAMLFRWSDGKLRNWGMTFGDSADPGYNLTGVLDALLDIKSQQIDGPRELLETRLPGDWVIREGAAEESVLKQLQDILQSELSLPVKLEFREVERDVYVARGEYELTPLPGQEGKGKLILTDETITTDEIQIFGTELVPNSGAGGGTGEFEEFLGWLGRWIGTPIVSEVDLKPINQVSWHLHEKSPSTDQSRSEDHDPILVLGNITLQTGLTFTLEKRPVRILFAEQTK